MQTQLDFKSGIVSSSFDLISTCELTDYQGTGRLYRHRRTKMEVFHIANKDRELFAGFAFHTAPYSGNGVAHILEHTVLAGSRNFPVKDPFMEVSKGSVNTFMNAMTFPGVTFYPFSTIIQKDFDNIFKVYSDAVFAPLLRKETFMLEGIRQDGDHFDGVVFNEMKGVYSDQEALVSSYSQIGLFDGTPFGYESGGDVTEIPDLSYEQYLETYKKWYQPSNCMLFLYGDMDAQRYMDFLDENYLRDAVFGYSQPLAPLTSGFDKSFAREVAGPDSAKSSVLVCWATTPESDPLEIITLSILVDILLGNPGNPLYRAISESDLGEDLSEQSGMGEGFGLMPFAVGFSGADRENALKIEKFILDTLSKICRNGLDDKLVNASLKNEAFLLQEVQRKGYPIGFIASQRALRAWKDGHSIFDSVQTASKLRNLRKKLEENPRYFEDWIQRNLIDNPHRMLLTVYPDENFEEKIEAVLKSKLKDMCAKEVESQKKLLDSFSTIPDQPEILARIGHLSRADLGDVFESFDYERRTVAGIDVYLQNMFTNGVCYYYLRFKTDGLSKEERLLIPLFLRMMTMAGVGDMDYSQVAIRMKELMGGLLMIPVSMMSVSHEYLGAVVAMMKTLSEDCDEALAFLAELMSKCDLSDESRVRLAITDLQTSFRSSFLEVAHSYGIKRAVASFTPAAKDQEMTSGITQWSFLDQLSSMMTSEIVAKLNALRRKIVSRNRLIVQIGCDSGSSDDCLAGVEHFVSIIGDDGDLDLSVAGDVPVLSSDDMVQIFSIPGQVAYNVCAIHFDHQTEKDRVGKMVLGAILSDNGLWDRIRRGGGAYMAYANMDMFNDAFLFASYRDPQINDSFNSLRLALLDIAEGKLDSDILESEVISIVGLELRPQSPVDMCSSGRRKFLLGLSDEMHKERIRMILGLTVEDISRQAKLILEHMDHNDVSSVVIAPKPLLKANGYDIRKSFKLSL
ncbi:MAG: hypothetical protein GXZ16_06095 [Spirochaetales bacterium]|jgi:presequence protease|nr:hypothetical protein [Spirochaetales bacterium]